MIVDHLGFRVESYGKKTVRFEFSCTWKKNFGEEQEDSLIMGCPLYQSWRGKQQPFDSKQVINL